MNRFIAPVIACLFTSVANADVVADHCEIFIDKMAAEQVNYHGAFGAILDVQAFIKIDAGRLAARGGARRVVFFGVKRTVDNEGRVLSEGNPREIELARFFSDDYYVLSLGELENHWWDRSNHEPSRAYEGAFFVETHDGARLWANPQGAGSHFLFDEMTARTLRDHGFIHAAYAPLGAARFRSLAEIPSTAEYNTYWNPGRCR